MCSGAGPVETERKWAGHSAIQMGWLEAILSVTRPLQPSFVSLVTRTGSKVSDFSISGGSHIECTFTGMRWNHLCPQEKVWTVSHITKPLDPWPVEFVVDCKFCWNCLVQNGLIINFMMLWLFCTGSGALWLERMHWHKRVVWSLQSHEKPLCTSRQSVWHSSQQRWTEVKASSGWSP